MMGIPFQIAINDQNQEIKMTNFFNVNYLYSYYWIH